MKDIRVYHAHNTLALSFLSYTKRNITRIERNYGPTTTIDMNLVIKDTHWHELGHQRLSLARTW